MKYTTRIYRDIIESALQQCRREGTGIPAIFFNKIGNGTAAAIMKARKTAAEKMKARKTAAVRTSFSIFNFFFLMAMLLFAAAGGSVSAQEEDTQYRPVEESIAGESELGGNRAENAELRTIPAGSEIGYPPYCIVNDQNEADGFSVELMRASLETMGYAVEFTVGPWTEVKRALETGAVEALPLVGRTPEREDDFDFTFPYLQMHGAIVVHEDNTSIRSLDDLHDKTIAVMEGDNAEEFTLRRGLGREIISTKTFTDALLMLSRGEVDAVITQRFLALLLMDQLGLNNLKITGSPIMEFDQSFCFAVQEGNKELLATLNEGLSIVIADGTYDELYAKWFGPIQSLARQFDRIIVGGDSEYPPYEYLDENGQPAGYNVDLTQAIAEEIGLEVEIVLDQWSRTYSRLLNKEIDIVHGVFYSTERDDVLSFSQPHTVVSHVAVTRKGWTNPGGESGGTIETMEDLSGLDILVMDGDIMHDNAVEYGYGGLVIPVKSQEEALRQLAEGRGDCALTAKIPAYYWIDQNGWENLDVGEQALFSPDYNYAVVEGNEHILMEFSEGLSSLVSKGKYREIYTKWFGAYEEEPVTFLDVLRTLSYVLVPILLLVLLILFWSWSLRRQVKTRTGELQQATDSLRNQITMKEQAEITLKESEAKFREYVENSPNGIFVTDEAGNYIEVNEAAVRITGYAKNELETMNHLDLAVPGDQEPSIRLFQFLQEYGRAAGTLMYRRKDGELRYWTINAVKLSSRRYLGFATDITDLKQAESRIIAEKERLNVTLRSIGDGVITTDTEGKVIIVNRVAEQLTGWTQREARGRQLNEIFYIINELTGRMCENPVDRVIQSGEIVELANHTMLISRNGEKYIIADSGAPIRDRESRIIGVVLVFRDMTDEYRMQEHMQRSAKLDSLGVLAGGIAHDFNNLLSGLFGYLQLARDGLKTGEDVEPYIREALQVFDRARGLTQQLLTFSRGGKPMRKTGNISGTVKASASFALSGSNIACEFQIPENLWLCDFDENQISQVIDNIVINAQQAMPSGGNITISLENVFLEADEQPPLPRGNYVHVEIQDTGIGMQPKMLDKIFDPFFTTKQKGSGLGLATCYSIIKKHDGIITVHSVPGEGTAFHIYLPKSMKEADRENTEKAKKHHGSGTVIVLDDERILRDVVGKMLESMGYSVIEAEDGKDVLELCDQVRSQQQKPDIVAALFDLTIPGGLGGKEVVQEVRTLCPEMPIFASSGYAEDPIMAEPQAYGFTDSIAKPFRRSELAALLAKYIKSGKVET